MAPERSVTIKKCGIIVGVGVMLLEEVCHCGGKLGGLIYAQDTNQFLRTLSAACGLRCRTLSSSTMSVCMLPCSAMTIMDPRTLNNKEVTPIKCFPLKVLL